MMELYISILFIIVILFALRLERKKYGTPSSPLTLVLVANIGVLILYFITYKWLGFHELKWTTVYIILRGIFLFAIVSILFSSARIKACNQVAKIQFVKEDIGVMCKVISFMTIFYMLYKVMQLGVSNIISDEDISDSFGGGGIGGHVLVLQTFLLTHILGRKFRVSNLPILLLFFFCLFMYNVKAWIIIPCLIGWYIHRDLYGVKINPIWFAIIPLLVFLIFTTSYFISLGWDLNNMSYIWAHFCKYIFAGIGGLNEAVTQNYPVGGTPLAGLPSFINLLFSIKAKSLYQFDYMVINDISGEYTNVLSLFGTTYYINGPIVGTIYVLVLAIISYILYNYRLNTNNYWFYLSYYMWASGLILSFFGNYYKLLNTWELTIFGFIVGIYHMSKKGSYYLKKSYK